MKTEKRNERKEKILTALVEMYIETGQAIGSNTLKDKHFPKMSSATIRNYFSLLEEEGLIDKPHISGGRIPTIEAISAYAQEHTLETSVPADTLHAISHLKQNSSEKLFDFLENATSLMSQLSNSAAFISSPRFDQDFVKDIKLVFLDNKKVLGVLVSHFGMVYSYVIPCENKLNTFSIKRIEEHFQKRLAQQPSILDRQEMELADFLYNELIIRFITSYANFSSEDLHVAGVSKLLHYPEFSDPSQIASALSLFENKPKLSAIARTASKTSQAQSFLGKDLEKFALPGNVALLTIPYQINETMTGVIGIVTSSRCNYKELFGTLNAMSKAISEALSENTFKFKISYRKPTPAQLGSDTEEILDQPAFYLEHKEDL